MLLGVTGRARAVGELTELIIGDELSDADGMSFKLSKVLNWSTTTCGEDCFMKFGFWIASSSGIMCKLLVGFLKKRHQEVEAFSKRQMRNIPHAAINIRGCLCDRDHRYSCTHIWQVIVLLMSPI